nr:MAG TPA: hypothetical protein [Caudoviricetes sp.]
MIRRVAAVIDWMIKSMLQLSSHVQHWYLSNTCLFM